MWHDVARPRVLYYDTPANRINLDGDALLVRSDDANRICLFLRDATCNPVYAACRRRLEAEPMDMTTR